MEERLKIADPSGSDTRSALPKSSQQQELLFNIGPEMVGQDSRRAQTGLAWAFHPFTIGEEALLSAERHPG